MGSGDQQKCPVCKGALKGMTRGQADFDHYKCPRCGPFSITRTAEASIRNEPPDPKLSAWLRQQSEAGTPHQELSFEALKLIRNSLPSYTPHQKQLILLQNIERNTKYPGTHTRLDPDDYPLAWADSHVELNFYIQALHERGLLRVGGQDLTITAKGWDFLDQHSRDSVISNQAFVAMSFAPKLRGVWEKAIKPAVEQAGFTPLRIDAKPHSDRIDVKIMAEIKASHFVIADVTGHRPGVYFEAGYALGLGIPVIWSVRTDDLDKAHFDTRQYSHLVWETEDDLQATLYDWICAIIGKSARIGQGDTLTH